MEESITKKQAAAEVAKHLIRNRNLSILSMISVFVVAVFSSFSFVAAAIMSGLICTGLALFAWKDITKYKYLKNTYEL